MVLESSLICVSYEHCEQVLRQSTVIARWCESFIVWRELQELGLRIKRRRDADIRRAG
jgi:hypothetical protein